MKNLLYIVAFLITIQLSAQIDLTKDPSFAIGGVYNQTVAGQPISDIAFLYPDGSMLVYHGFTTSGSDFNHVFAKITTTGTLDTTYATAGILTLSTASEQYFDYAVEQSGKLLLVFTNSIFYSAEEFPSVPASGRIVRISALGSVDSSFGTGGVVERVWDVSSHEKLDRPIQVLSGGKILMSTIFSGQTVLGMLLSNGSTDATYGSMGGYENFANPDMNQYIEYPIGVLGTEIYTMGFNGSSLQKYNYNDLTQPILKRSFGNFEFYSLLGFEADSKVNCGTRLLSNNVFGMLYYFHKARPEQSILKLVIFDSSLFNLFSVDVWNQKELNVVNGFDLTFADGNYIVAGSNGTTKHGFFKAFNNVGIPVTIGGGAVLEETDFTVSEFNQVLTDDTSIYVRGILDGTPSIIKYNITN